jgi:LysR family transcriptional regulator, transcriptional activator of nhaA
VSPGREVLRVGVVAGLPKTLVHHLLSPALDMMDTGTLQVLQQNSASSLKALAAGRLHLVISDDVPAAATGLKIHAHALGETDVLFYASAAIAASLSGKFPRSLEKAWFVLPPVSVALRRSLDDWFLAHQLDVNIKAEIEDAGLLRAFGSAGRGIFPVRAALRAEVEDLHDVKKVGACKGVRERYFLLSTERRIKHRGVSALIDGARRGLHAVATRGSKAP